MKSIGDLGRWIGVTAVSAGAAGSASAEEAYGHSVPGQVGFQLPVTDVARYIESFHNYGLLPVIIIISLFVLALLAYVVWRFNEKANPVPSKTTHNTAIEVIWTIVPVIILVFLAIPSFRLLTMQLTIPPVDVTVKVTASQWHWNYGYPKEEGGFAYDSYMKEDKELKAGDIKYLSVDNEAVVPVNKVIRLEVTSTDVIHSFIVQAFGSRVDAVPGRLNETWFKADREGVYYGQCNELCGVQHYFMPIMVDVRSPADYEAWVATHGKPAVAAAPAAAAPAAPAATSASAVSPAAPAAAKPATTQG